MNNFSDIRIHYKMILQLFFFRLFGLKFHARQNYPPLNNGYDSYHLKDPGDCYFYGNYEEFRKFHNHITWK